MIGLDAEQERGMNEQRLKRWSQRIFISGSGGELLFVRPGQFNSIDVSEGAKGCLITFTTAFINLTDKDSESIYQNILFLPPVAGQVGHVPGHH
ncbi:MAG: hypothetical protein EOP84_13550 [Verrucomicrobiaceae bacterium]|nr:MAG: hypothetical protein EOP84_13550 [Verrucomicrobiaceae bacterium]